MSVYEKGICGEDAAIKVLTQKGMTCLGRRVRGASGEIDLVMQGGGVIVFVEVKYRPTQGAGAGLVSVTPQKRRRMAQAAQAYLIAQNLTDSPARFDVVEITGDGAVHIENAFDLSV